MSVDRISHAALQLVLHPYFQGCVRVDGVLQYEDEIARNRWRLRPADGRIPLPRTYLWNHQKRCGEVFYLRWRDIGAQAIKSSR